MIRMSLTAPGSSFARTVSRQFEMGADDDVSKIDLFFKVVSFYGYRENVGRLDWYLHGGGDVALSDLPAMPGTASDKYHHIREVLRRHDLDPIVFDCTPAAMRHVALLKVFMPELTQPFIQSLPIFGHPRFASAAQLLGKSTQPTSFADLVTDPLPYP
jgi:ribosomal protein S12 methylthiotransferase accessory factor